MAEGSPILSPQQISAMFQDSLTWDRETMAEYQRKQLSQLLQHARATVPFYKNRLDLLFRNDGSIDWSRWRDLPILTRSDLRDSAERLKTTAPIERHGSWGKKSSSGSTGVPITVAFTQFFIEIAGYGWDRFHKLNGFHANNGSNEFVMALPASSPPDAESLARTGGPGIRPALLILRTLPVQRKLQHLCRSGFHTLMDSANHAEILARENLRQGKPLSLTGIECIGTGITEEQQSLFAESFGTRAISPYSSSEAALMAFECPHGHDHLHVCSETVLLEILDDKGREVPAGESGRAVVTPFFNSAQPLIRYEQGDILVRGKACPGGITLPVIQQIIGRSDAIFKFPDHEVSVFGLDIAFVRNQLQADAFQIAQTAAQALELRYLSANVAGSDATQSVTAELRKFFRPEISIAFRRVADIPFNAGGKQQRYVREFEL